MTIKIFQIGDPIIRKKAKRTQIPIGSSTAKIIETMVAAMREARLVGIAAPQIGESVRIIASEIASPGPRSPTASPLTVYINPKITWLSEDTDIAYEGCGSVADANIFGEVERSKSVELDYLDADGHKHTQKMEGFLARIIQHEIDHLDGIVFTDKLVTPRTLLSGSEYRRMIQERNAKKAHKVKR